MVDTASSGTYELLRARLQEQATELSRRAEALNELRLAEFGSSRFEVVASERIRTENNCIPRDIAPVGDHLLLGYNVFLGLKPQTTVGDVFSLHRFEQVDDTYALHPLAADADGSMLQDPAFVRDFDELYRYYKQTRLVQLQRAGNLLLAAFQIGDQVSDQRVLRWEVDRTGSVSYVDNRGERDLPHHPQFDFAWQPVGREHHRDGRVLLVDRVVVDPLGGTLEIRLEDNTPNGQVVLRETVQDPDQSLADCVMSFALLGDLLVLRVQPYAESTVRHFVVNLLTRQAQRIDALGLCCHQLPEDHGLIFPGGYYLRSGDTKTFDLDARDMALQTVVRSPNGEDVLFAFYEPVGGRSILLSYNMIRRELENPLHCHGWSLFDDGTLVVFREQAEPTRVHPVQMWRTPYESDEHASAQSLSDTPLGRIGNAELVRGVSEALAIRRLVAETTPSMEVYEDLATSVIRVLDAHWWLGEDAVGDLASPLTEIRDTAELVVDEFEKVVALQQAASERLAEAETDVGALLDELGAVPPSTTDDFVAALSSLRRRQGHLVGLGEVRYVDAERLGALTARVTEAFDGLSRRAVEFLAGADAFAGLHRRVEDLAAEVEGASTTASLEEVGERVEAAAEDVDTLTTVVGGLEIEDPTLRTGILERIAEVLAGLNRVRALATTRRQELTGSEQAAAFAVEFQLFSQAASASLAQAATPQRCDAALGELMVALETLETRFRDSDDFADQLATKREDVYESFAAKRQQLVDERQRAAERLSDAAARILGSVQRRLDGFDSLDDVHAFFLSDPMVAKVRSVGEELRELGEPVRTDELATRLAALRDEAARSLRDRAELFEDDGSVVRLGRHRFSVEHRPLELTTVPSGDRLDLALTGTDFRLSLDEPALESTRAHWSQIIVSETEAVARAEYLAASLLLDAIDADADLTELREARTRPDGIAELVRRAAEARFDEGYDRGVHDHDAARLLEVLVDRYDAVGLLRHEPDARALAQLFWAHGLDDEARSDWQLRCRSLGQLRTRYRHSPVLAEVVSELAELIEGFAAGERLRHLDVAPHAAAAYLFEELTRDRLEFAASRGAVELGDAFRLHVDVGAQHLDDALAALD
ncbi:MAG: DNA repair ATPase, partial [Acidimicrobiales bacterium]|nr:DNA repair ATPase [Acidimicrobiales bacterium]